MPSPFSITSATNSLHLDEKRRGQTTFTVFNAAGRPLRGRARLVAEPPEGATWLKLKGEAERSFAIAGTEQYAVKVKVPEEAPAGSYTFRLDMIDVGRPDEGLVQGPAVTFEVGKPEPQKESLPWLWMALAGLVLVGGLAAVLLWPGSNDRAGELLEKLEQAEERVAAIENDVSANDEAIQKARLDKEAKDDEVRRLEALPHPDLEAAEAAAEEAAQRLRDLEAEGAGLRRQLEETRRNITQLENEIENAPDNLQRLRGQVDAAQDRVRALQNVMGKLVSQEKPIDHLTPQLLSAKEELERARENLQDAEERTKNLPDMLEQARERVVAIEQDIRANDEAVLDARFDKEAKDGEVRRLEALPHPDLEAAEAAAEEAAQRLRDLEAEGAKLRGLLEEARRELAQFEDEINPGGRS